MKEKKRETKDFRAPRQKKVKRGRQRGRKEGRKEV